MKPIQVVTKAVVELDGCDEAVLREVVDFLDGIGHEDINFYFDWDDEDEAPLFKAFLLETYGPTLKMYEALILAGC